MSKLKLVAIGTPVLDRFAKVQSEFLKKWDLIPGSTNFISRMRLEELEKALGEKLFLSQAGDNARTLCDTFARLERIANAKKAFWNRFAAPHVAYAGSVGGDEAGAAIEQSLTQAGAQSLLRKASGRTGEILCLITPDAQRTFAADLGVGEQFHADVHLPSSDMLFFTSITALCAGSVASTSRQWMKQAREKRVKVTLSLESPKMLSVLRSQALALAREPDILFLNLDEMEALRLTEKTAGALAPLVFIKKGAAGSTIYEEGKKTADIVATKASAVVDTTGAGDTYAGGVLWGLSQGMTPQEAARVGSKVAAATVARFGGGLPDGFRLE